MRSRVLVAFLGLVTGWAAAGFGILLPAERGKQPSQPPPPYTERRWVGLKQAGLADCPPIPGWPSESMLQLAHDEADREGTKWGEKDLQLLRKYDLDRFCVYRADDPLVEFPKPLPAGLMEAVRDQMAVFASASEVNLGAIGDQTWQTFAGHFLDQVGKVRLLRTDQPSVRLVFVDTQRTGEGAPPLPLSTDPSRPPSLHGYSMAHLAQQLACSNDDEPRNCAVHIATRLALHYDAYDPNMPFVSPPDPGKESGRLGTVSDLAVAILAEIKHWQELQPRAKLILNLSVGWDGELHDASQISALDARKASELEPSAQAVYQALRYAADRGVLVIAAAGNRRGGPEKSAWPLLPAAWELRRPSWLPFPFGCKPVYAVGGLDWQGLPLPNSRLGGIPRRTAYADHAVVGSGGPTAGNGGSTMIYTGTSVSTAVTSSIAAVIWSLQPDLQPAHVMKEIGRSSEALRSRADFYAWKPLSFLAAPHLERVSLCRTVLRLCSQHKEQCPALEAIECQFGEHPAADFSYIKLTESTPTAFQRIAVPPPCNPGAQIFSDTGSTLQAMDLCPMAVLPDMNTPGWVGPQPGDNPCPTCTIVPDPPGHRTLAAAGSDTSLKPYYLAVAIDPKWQATASATIDSATLVIDCSGTPTMMINITDKIPPPPASALISLGRLKTLVGCTSSLDFSLGTPGLERSVQSPVYVDP